jgi:uncharacterized protein (TIGR02265 family)
LARTPAKPILRVLPPPGEIGIGDVIAGDIDTSTALGVFPREHTLKGMFFSRFVRELGTEWPRIEQRLVAPPRLGTYLPFADYPLVDHADIAILVAKKRAPSIPHREALRRLAREDIATFLDSTIGRVTAAVVSSPRAALMALPEAYRRVVSGPTIQAAALADDRIRLSFVSAFGLWEYQIGQIEGIVRHYGGQPRTRCALADDGVRTYDVSW